MTNQNDNIDIDPYDEEKLKFQKDWRHLKLEHIEQIASIVNEKYIVAPITMMGDGWHLYNFKYLYNSNKFGSDGQNWYSTPGVTGEYKITNMKLDMEEDPNMTQLPIL